MLYDSSIFSPFGPYIYLHIWAISKSFLVSSIQFFWSIKNKKSQNIIKIINRMKWFLKTWNNIGRKYQHGKNLAGYLVMYVNMLFATRKRQHEEIVLWFLIQAIHHKWRAATKWLLLCKSPSQDLYDFLLCVRAT